jgi:hypothetical protein
MCSDYTRERSSSGMTQSVSLLTYNLEVLRSYRCLYTACPNWGVTSLTFWRCWVHIPACTPPVLTDVFLHLHFGGAEVVSPPVRLSYLRCFFTYILEVLSSYPCLYTACPNWRVSSLTFWRCWGRISASTPPIVTEVLPSLWSVIPRTFQSGALKQNTKA